MPKVRLTEVRELELDKGLDLSEEFAHFRRHVQRELNILADKVSYLEASWQHQQPKGIRFNSASEVVAEARNSVCSERESLISNTKVTSAGYKHVEFECGLDDAPNEEDENEDEDSSFPHEKSWNLRLTCNTRRLTGGLSDRDWKLAFARTAIGITMRDGGVYHVEQSVYGAAMLLPQLARTVGWDLSLTVLAVRSYLFLVLNFLLQAYLLSILFKEQRVLDLYAGQMSLCDFGAFMETDRGASNRGPLGTVVTPSRLYNWNVMVSRTFVKDSLKLLFPDRIDEINDKVDIGEYGVESYWCRLVCCFIFMITCMEEFIITFKMAHLLYRIPTKADAWIHPKADLDSDQLMGAINEVTIRVAGMPMAWKIFYSFILVLPKFVLWKVTCETGVTFLMETSNIDDLILNCVGLTFILGMDELIFNALMSEETLNLVSAAEDYILYDETTSCVGDISLLTDDEILEKYLEKHTEIRDMTFRQLKEFIPVKLVFTLLGSAIFVGQYYLRLCTPDNDNANHMVSKDMYLPKSLRYTWMNVFFPYMFPLETEEVPFWRMPTK